MKVSVALTLSPLQDDFQAPALAFIKRLRALGPTVLGNPLSTQVYGEYNRVMELLQDEIREAFESLEHVIVTMKLIKSDRSGYGFHF